jgi:hypothetical protein
VSLIDMHKKSEAVIVKYGIEGSRALFLQLKPGENPNYPNGIEGQYTFPAGRRRRNGEVGRRRDSRR